MKDLLNIKITAVQENGITRVTLVHKKRPDISFAFKMENTIEAARVPALLKWVFRSWVNEYTKNIRRPLLSNKQKKAYAFILDFYKEAGRAPTYEEIREGLGFASRGSAHTHVKNIIARGWLWRDEDGKIVPYDLAAPEVSD